MPALEAQVSRRAALPAARHPMHDGRVTTRTSAEPGPPSAEAVRVSVAAADRGQRARLTALLAAEPDFRLVRDDTDSADVVVVWSDEPGNDPADGKAPRVILADWTSPGEFPVLTESAGGFLYHDATDEDVVAAVRAVAAGLTVIDPELAARALAQAPRGEASRQTAAPSDELLTAREREVLGLMAAGLPNKGIARELGISEHTAKYHVGAILSKLDAQSRAEAVMLAARRGWLAL